MIAVVLASMAVLAVGACAKKADDTSAAPSSTTLRVGVAQLSAANPINGLRQLATILSLEGLVRSGEDGRMQPWLAESLTPSSDGRSLTVRLRANVKLHDGSILDAATVAQLLPTALQSFMGPLYPDIAHIRATGADTVEIGLRQPSPFAREALEAPIQKPGKTLTGTGPFAVGESPTELRANTAYYLGRPGIGLVHVETYPSVRTAWAEMLRDQLDLLYEVGPDAVDSMRNSKTISIFTFTRKYQHVIILNSRKPALRSARIRQALNLAVNRDALVKNALKTYGVAAVGPLWPHHWALAADAPQFSFDPGRAAQLIAGTPSLKFSCLVTGDSLDERIALEVKRQLNELGVEMSVTEASRDEIVRVAGKGEYDAALIDVLNGPTIFRPYLSWHSGAPLNWGGFGNAAVDAGLDAVRAAQSDDAYRQAVAGLQRAFYEDPPAIFLAWSMRARAWSKRFEVPAIEPGREVMSNLRLWRRVTDNR